MGEGFCGELVALIEIEIYNVQSLLKKFAKNLKKSVLAI